MKKRLKQINFKKGAVEALGFAIAAPLLLFIATFILATAQVTLALEDLERYNYTIARQVVVADSEKDAKKRAKDLQEHIIGDRYGINPGNTKIKIKNLSEKHEWKKGNYVEVTLTAELNNILFKFYSRNYQNSIVMMIENSDEGAS